MASMREEWERLRKIRQASTEEAERVKFPPTQYRQRPLDESMEKTVDEVIEATKKEKNDG